MWKLKVLLQCVLAVIPAGERINHLLQKAAKSYTPERTRERVIEIAECLPALRRHVDLAGATIVEVGTGWDAIGAIVLHLAGAGPIYTFDHLRHLRYPLARRVIDQARQEADLIARLSGQSVSNVRRRADALLSALTIDDVFRRAQISYLAPADASTTILAAGSTDVFFSFTVLEHVPAITVTSLTREAERVLKPTGVAYHVIGLQDHYNSISPRLSKVNFLKYPEWAWRLLVKNRLSYHNRLREVQFRRLFEEAGAEILEMNGRTDPADIERVKVMRVDSYFAGMTPEELAVNSTEAVMRFPRKPLAKGS
jgi:hypothetical protein